jgi:hypothetical protein
MLILPARAASPQPASVNAVPTDVFRQPLCPAGVVHQHRPPKDIAPDHDAVRAECAPQFISQVTTVCGLPHGGTNVSQKAEGATPQCQHMALSVDSLRCSMISKVYRT